MFSFSDLCSKSYASGNICVQIVSFRANTRLHDELVITDFTPELTRVAELTAPVNMARYKTVTARIGSKAFAAVAAAYRDRFSSDLFLRTAVDLDRSLWIDVLPSLCFVDIAVATAVGGLPQIIRAKLVREPASECPELWLRSLDACSQLLASHRGAAKLAAQIRGDASNSEDKLSAEGSPRVKIEHEIKSENGSAPSSQLQTAFRSHLEPDTMAPTHLAAPDRQPQNAPEPSQEYLTQLNGRSQMQQSGPFDSQSGLLDSQNRPSDSQNRPFDSQTGGSPDSHAYLQFASQTNTHPGNRFDTLQSRVQQIGPQLDISQSNSRLISEQAILAAQERGDTVTLECLARLPLRVDHRIYKTTARIVGSTPSDWSLICTKPFVAGPGDVRLGDPQIRLVELFLATAEKLLLPENSLVAYVPERHVLSFFGCTHTEQLYTRLSKLESQLGGRLADHPVEISLAVDYVDDLPQWTLKDTTLARLVG